MIEASGDDGFSRVWEFRVMYAVDFDGVEVYTYRGFARGCRDDGH